MCLLRYFQESYTAMASRDPKRPKLGQSMRIIATAGSKCFVDCLHPFESATCNDDEAVLQFRPHPAEGDIILVPKHPFSTVVVKVNGSGKTSTYTIDVSAPAGHEAVYKQYGIHCKSTREDPNTLRIREGIANHIFPRLKVLTEMHDLLTLIKNSAGTTLKLYLQKEHPDLEDALVHQVLYSPAKLINVIHQLAGEQCNVALPDRVDALFLPKPLEKYHEICGKVAAITNRFTVEGARVAGLLSPTDAAQFVPKLSGTNYRIARDIWPKAKVREQAYDSWTDCFNSKTSKSPQIFNWKAGSQIKLSWTHDTLTVHVIQKGIHHFVAEKSTIDFEDFKERVMVEHANSTRRLAMHFSMVTTEHKKGHRYTDVKAGITEPTIVDRVVELKVSCGFSSRYYMLTRRFVISTDVSNRVTLA